MEQTHKEIWTELKELSKLSYQQQTQIEVLKEQVSEEKMKKEKSQAFNNKALFWLGSALIGVLSFTWTQSEKITRYDEQIQTIRNEQAKEAIRVTAISEDVVTVQEWVEENYVQKQ